MRWRDSTEQAQDVLEDERGGWLMVFEAGLIDDICKLHIAQGATVICAARNGRRLHLSRRVFLIGNVLSQPLIQLSFQLVRSFHEPICSRCYGSGYLPGS